MRWKPHGELEGRHAFLSPSNYYWLRYDPEKLVATYGNRMEAALGTRKHNLAKELILLRQELPHTSQTLNMYVNDCIGFRMDPEIPLYSSPLCFGTADAISFRDAMLRIFDLKTGVTPAGHDQLYTYAALFCKEYGVKPMTIDYDLRIYQSDEIIHIESRPDYVAEIISVIEQAESILTSDPSFMLVD